MREGWKEVKLGDLVTTHKGYAFKSKWYQDTGVAIVRVSDFNENSISTDSLFYISNEIAENYEKYKLKDKDVVIQTVGSGPNNPLSIVGKVICVPSDLDDALLNQNAVKLLPLKSIDKRFLYYRLKDEHFKYYCLNHSKGGANQMSITLDSIKRFKFQLPPLKTQRKIASILSAYDDLIENNLKRIKLLEEQAQLTYEEWFVRFKFPGHETTKFNEETGLPEGWERKGLGEFTDIKKGKNITKATIKEGNVPVIAGGLKPAYYHNKPNTINPVITVSASGANAGYTAIQLEDVWASDCSFIDSSMTKYLHFVYCTMIANQPKIYHFQKGAAQPHVYPKDLVKLEVTIPSIEVIQVFEDLAKNIFDSIRIFIKQNQHLKEARDILLPRLMSGMIDPSTSSGQVVEELEVGSLKYEVNDSLGMVAEAGSVYEKDKAEIDSLFNTLNYDYEIAVVVLLTRQILNRNYGKKYIHKMFSNIKFLEALPVFKDLEFQENHWGMYCPVLEKTIGNQKYIQFDNIDDERSVINFNYKFIKEVTNWMNQDDYAKKFVSQVKNMLSIYQKSLIRMDMDRIELLNTVLECMSVLETNKFDAIWRKMENWKMQEEGYKTKAEKFKPRETELMIDLIKELK